MDDAPHSRVRPLGPLSKELVELALSPLVGLPFTGFYKPLFAIFEFGDQRPDKNRNGEDVTFADWNIAFSCSWQVTKADMVVLGSNDMPWSGKRKRRFFQRTTPPPDPWKRIRWQLANEFFDVADKGNLHVVSVSSGSAGAVSIQLTDEYAIRAFNADSGFYCLWTIRNLAEDYAFTADLRPEGLVAFEIKPT